MNWNCATNERPPTRLLNRGQIKSRIPVSDVTLWRWEKLGILPPPIRIAGRPYQPAHVIDALISDGVGAV